ncbi:DUF559 domain-containing protein [Cryptosporangium aurantiacum]|uniref:DUF559 domain-containing protein n=1 Tax=Cryptosporangium aurantiacum TaxID=134849 RepID=A0A1M7IUL5_9ACTN|nr:DUF559 domain-containing protein [Cryptosporangium aurantiacum]SHM44430.1 Protein of unknown function [Cryptosporangium aurantiacum]
MGTALSGQGWQTLLAHQQGAVSRTQLLAHGVSAADIAANLAAKRWQRPIPGIYVTFTGPLPFLTRIWVALLHAGPDAVLSHETAGVLWRLLPARNLRAVHVTVPRHRGTRSRRGIVVHHARDTPVPTGYPPRTAVAITALELCAVAKGRPDDAAAVLGRVAQQYPEALPDVRALALERRNLPGRRDILDLIDDAGGGAHSALERRFLVDVERAHGLPVGERQRAVGGNFQDVHHREYRTTIELDGAAVHQSTAAARRDMSRDNAAAVRGEATLRYGWQDVRRRPCAVAAEVATVLRTRGWTGTPTRCGPNCRI